MVLECELAVKLHAKDVEVGTRPDRNRRQNQITMGRVHRPGSTSNESLNFVRIQYHAPMIVPLLNPAKSLLEAVTAGLSAGLRTTARILESSAYAYSLFLTLEHFAGI